jgi:hypothetical protein
MLPIPLAPLDRQLDHLPDSRVALVKRRDDGRVAVDAESELGEVVGADGEAVVELGEFVD